jgi:DDE superfamily endonuclease
VQTTEYAAVTAAYSVDPDRWQAEFSAVTDRIAPRFSRREPLGHASELMLGLLSGLDRKNCWTIGEHRGNATPDGLQHLLARAKWDADAVRDDLRDYVTDAFGDPGAVLVLDETGDVKKGVHSTIGVDPRREAESDCPHGPRRIACLPGTFHGGQRLFGGGAAGEVDHPVSHIGLDGSPCSAGALADHLVHVSRDLPNLHCRHIANVALCGCCRFEKQSRVWVAILRTNPSAAVPG